MSAGTTESQKDTADNKEGTTNPPGKPDTSLSTNTQDTPKDDTLKDASPKDEKPQGETTNSTNQEKSTTDTPPRKPFIDAADPIALVFQIVYSLGGAVAAVMVLVVFILATYDILKFSVTSTMQYVSILNNPNIYNKDTEDFKALMYYRNSTDTEPYSIFNQQQIAGGLFYLGLAIVACIGLQVIVMVVMAIISSIKQEPMLMGNIEFSKNARPLMIVMVGIVFAFVWSAIYNTRFLGHVQPSIVYTHDNIEQVKNYIYDNLTNNEAFLTNLINGDLMECIRIMNQQTNDSRIARMIYTMSLYNFFKINISENEEAFNTVIREIFTVAEIRVRGVNPVDYMYFNQNVFLPNLYPIVRPYIYGSNNAISTSTRDKIIRLDITQRINETNKRLMTLFKVPERRTQLRNYIILSFVVALVFIFIIYGLYKDSIKQLIGEELMTVLKSVLKNIIIFLIPFKSMQKEDKEDKEGKAAKAEQMQSIEKGIGDIATLVKNKLNNPNEQAFGNMPPQSSFWSQLQTSPIVQQMTNAFNNPQNRQPIMQTMAQIQAQVQPPQPQPQPPTKV